MSNLFKKTTGHRNNAENKQNEILLNNKKDLNPKTIIIKKAKRNPSKINENIKINNIKDDYKEQNTQKINISKKAKNAFKDSNKSIKRIDMNPNTVVIIHRSSRKTLRNGTGSELKKSLNHNNKNKNKINIDTNLKFNFMNDENNEVNTYLKNKSASKNYKKKNNFLTESINLNILNFDQNANEIEENQVKKLIDKPSSNKKKELFKIDEEKTSEINLKIKLRQNEIKEKEIEKNQNSKSNSNNNLNFNIEKTFKRSMTKKYTFQSNDIFKKERPYFNFVKKNSLKLSSKELGAFRNIIRDSFLSKSVNPGKKNNNSINNIIIPMINRKKENNCFLNVIIQNLSHLQNFKNDLLQKESLDGFMKSKPINEFYNLIKLYESEQIKFKENTKENKGTNIEPILSVNNLRYSLNEVFGRYQTGISGDPMETMNSIFDLIHEAYCKKNRIDKKKIISCKCLVHKHFFLQLADIQCCPNCNSKKAQQYDKDCFMYNLYIQEIMNKLHGKNYNSFKLKLFQKIKEHNQTFEEKTRPKIPGCNCSEKLRESYLKTTKLMGPLSTYLILNITFAEEFPSMNEILKTYALLPIKENIHELFSFDKSIKNLTNNAFSIKGIILFGIYHYVCALYIKDENRWAVVDDKTIKYIDKYYTLIDSLLRNHLMPVGIIYSKDENDEINDNIINNMCLSNDEYSQLYQFSKDVDKRRGLKSSEIFQSKFSFDEDKGDYYNNNLFFSIFDNSNDAKNTQNLINSIIINDKKDENKNEAQDKKDNEIINKENDKDKDKDKDKNNLKGGIFSFTKKFGNNLRGGIIDFSDENEEKTPENKKEGNDDNKDLIGLGNDYEE